MFYKQSNNRINGILEKKRLLDPQWSQKRRSDAVYGQDVLVHENPHLTEGYVTTMDVVDEYFEKKFANSDT